MVRAVSLSHQVVGSKQPLRRFCGGKACLGFSLLQTPLMWKSLALGLPFIKYVSVVHLFRIVDFSIFFYKLGQEVWLGTKLKHHTVLELKVNP